MRRPWQIWLAYGLCLAVVVAAMASLSWRAVELDRNEAQAREQAALEENARLALWRMDSALAPLVSQESARPYFMYSAFYPAERAYGRMFNSHSVKAVHDDGLQVPSPLLTSAQPPVVLHFQFDPDGKLTSPQVPTGPLRAQALLHYPLAGKIELAEAQLAKVRALLKPRQLLAELPTDPAPALEPLLLADGNFNNGNSSANNYAQTNSAQVGNAQNGSAQANGPANGAYGQEPEVEQRQQRERNNAEFMRRWQYVAQNSSQQLAQNDNGLTAPSDVRTAAMRPLWVNHELLLARRVTINDRDYVQGCLLDWPAIRAQLLGAIQDLLPAADLMAADPVTAVALPEAEQQRQLASLPIALLPGALPESPGGGLSPIRLSLIVAWSCLVLAAIAVAVLLRGVMTLSERRGAFVSAVTHELRTPLTTFRMYAEMLAEGMVPSEEARRKYLNTLRVEADRLTHLVENVLAYARLERGRPAGRLQCISIEQLLRHVTERLSQRAEQADLELAVEVSTALQDTRVLADPSAVDQVLFNLVDNACKYAGRSADRTLRLDVNVAGRRVELRLRDHGPGIASCQRRQLFQPFRKSADEAAMSAPGVGLGLALSWRLARDMGGSLSYDANYAEGACFMLSLPLASGQAG